MKPAPVCVVCQGSDVIIIVLLFKNVLLCVFLCLCVRGRSGLKMDNRCRRDPNSRLGWPRLTMEGVKMKGRTAGDTREGGGGEEDAAED